MTQPHYAYVMALIRALEKLGIETMVRGELLADHIERLLQLKPDESAEAEYASWVGPAERKGIHVCPRHDFAIVEDPKAGCPECNASPAACPEPSEGPGTQSDPK